MIGDEVLDIWWEDYDEATVYSFAIYGPLTDDDCNIVATGLKVRLGFAGEDNNFLIVQETVDEDIAKALRIKRGFILNVIAPKKKKSVEKMVIETVTEGLNYLRLENKFISKNGVARLV